MARNREVSASCHYDNHVFSACPKHGPSPLPPRRLGQQTRYSQAIAGTASNPAQVPVAIHLIEDPRPEADGNQCRFPSASSKPLMLAIAERKLLTCPFSSGSVCIGLGAKRYAANRSSLKLPKIGHERTKLHTVVLGDDRHLASRLE
jgi:hypothetical protein